MGLIAGTTRELDDLIHQRARLGILAVLQEVERADFATLADLLGLTAGNLSRNLTRAGGARLRRHREDVPGTEGARLRQ